VHSLQAALAAPLKNAMIANGTNGANPSPDKADTEAHIATKPLKKEDAERDIAGASPKPIWM
jgi:hypothetical protein